MKIALLGDIALIGKFDRSRNRNVDSLFTEIKEYISDCDYVIANLEAILTGIKKTSQCKGVYLRTDSSSIETLLALGITHVTLANNHCHDYGRRALEENLALLRKNRVQYVGLNHSPCLMEKGDDRAILTGFCCYSSNGLFYGEKEGEISVLSPENLLRFLSYANEIQAYPIVSAHFGIEGVHYPSTEHIKMFRKFAEKYDYTLHGHHPHVIQGMEQCRNSLLAYSLGNFCFGTIENFSMKNQEPEEPALENRKTTVVKLSVERNRLLGFERKCFLIDENGYFHRSELVEEELNRYSFALKRSPEDYQELRMQAIMGIQERHTNRNIRFYFNRLNRKYMGAYINGHLHAKEYRKIYSNYFGR